MAVKRKYSNKEKKAYYMGLGMGLIDPPKENLYNNQAFDLMKINERQSFENGFASGCNYKKLIKQSKRDDFVPLMSFEKYLKINNNSKEKAKTSNTKTKKTTKKKN